MPGLLLVMPGREKTGRSGLEGTGGGWRHRGAGRLWAIGTYATSPGDLLQPLESWLPWDEQVVDHVMLPG